MARRTGKMRKMEVSLNIYELRTGNSIYEVDRRGKKGL